MRECQDELTKSQRQLQKCQDECEVRFKRCRDELSNDQEQITKCIEELKKKSEGLSSYKYKFAVTVFGLLGAVIGIIIGLTVDDTTGKYALILRHFSWHYSLCCTWHCSCWHWSWHWSWDCT